MTRYVPVLHLKMYMYLCVFVCVYEIIIIGHAAIISPVDTLSDAIIISTDAAAAVSIAISFTKYC